MIPEESDAYQEDLHLERKAREGWHFCKDCRTWIHDDDISEGTSCKCEEEE